jgi:hypothetical protein
MNYKNYRSDGTYNPLDQSYFDRHRTNPSDILFSFHLYYLLAGVVIFNYL